MANEALNSYVKVYSNTPGASANIVHFPSLQLKGSMLY